MLYSYVMNNYWHTNYKAEQEGTVTLRYMLRPHNGFDLSETMRFGIEQSQPLLCVPADTTKPSQSPLFVVDPSSVIVSAVRPAKDQQGWIVRLFNASANPVQATLRWNKPQNVGYYASDALESKKEEIKFPITLPQLGTATIRIE
jgi:alpha-mannosidase